MTDLEKLISDHELDIAFAGTNFGDVDKRKLIAECLLKKASGYPDAHTITGICKDLYLISNTTNNLLRRGKEFLFTFYYGK